MKELRNVKLQGCNALHKPVRKAVDVDHFISTGIVGSYFRVNFVVGNPDKIQLVTPKGSYILNRREDTKPDDQLFKGTINVYDVYVSFRKVVGRLDCYEKS